MTSEQEMDEISKQAVIEGVRKIMDARVDLCRIGVLAPEVDKYLIAAVANLSSYYGDLLESVKFMLSLKEEYVAKLQAANAEQIEKFGHLIGEVTATQAEDF